MIVLNTDGKFEIYEGTEGYNRLIMLPKGAKFPRAINARIIAPMSVIKTEGGAL